ncbi:CLUMA_CG018023, isoform A [Clunio marinus]|uniref:CLUMA_CG018023, isoform A n=1 Tax=Clunio marinus TaxID=568069 RepID=A0A1J1J2M6_9DIPT|nr:CLUMA_CG018023, isoform A [Clunio marinus]
MKLIFAFIFVLCFVNFGFAEISQIEYTDCGEAYETLRCTVDNVNGDCLIDRNTKACRLKRGNNYTMNVDFTPDFEGDDVTMLAYALLPGGIDAPFEGMDDNACHWMTCPVVKDTKQTYTFKLSIRRSYPKGIFQVRWLMKKAGEPKCCLFLLFSAFLIILSAYPTVQNQVPAEYGSCPESDYEDLKCTIDSVTVEGCRKDRNSGACKVKRNVNATIKVEFTPDFDGDDVTMMAYALMPGIEKSFPDMDPDACKFMTCPVVSGTSSTYSFGLKLASAYPLGLFNVRFLMKKGGEAKCCFVTKFRIEK